MLPEDAGAGLGGFWEGACPWLVAVGAGHVRPERQGREWAGRAGSGRDKEKSPARIFSVPPAAAPEKIRRGLRRNVPEPAASAWGSDLPW